MDIFDVNFAYDFLNNRKKQAEQKDKMTNIFAGTPTGIFAEGGGIHIKHPGRLTALKERTGKTEAELWAEGRPEVRKMITFARNARKWKHAEGGPLNVFVDDTPLFAFGGNMQTNSADFSTGLTHINAGQSHEESPYDGVQLGVDPNGVPNLVEENETVWNDYVFSARITADDVTKKKFHLQKKKDITYAEISKRLEKEIKERPNDPVSKASFKAQMEQLADEQERQKQEMEAERAKAAFEALSPEEQTALMQQRAQEEAIAEQAIAQQAMAEAQRQPTPEELAMAQQAAGVQANPAAEPQQFDEGGGIVRGENGLIDYDKTLIDLPEIVAIGSKNKIKKPQVRYAAPGTTEAILEGLNELHRQEVLQQIADNIAERNAIKEAKEGRTRIHYYADGGELRKQVYNLLHINTDSEFKDWIEKNGKGKLDYEIINDLLNKGDLEALRNNESFWKLAAKDSPALAHAIESGYNFGAYTPDGEPKSGYVWEDLWPITNEISKLKGNNKDKYQIDRLYNKKEVKDIEARPEYQAFTNYILNDATDEERKKYFRWIDDNTGRDRAYTDEEGNLLDGWQDKYKSARTDGLWGIQHYYPELTELQRGAIAKNFVQNPDGTWEEIRTDVPADWTAVGNYSWATPENDMAYSYYTRPVVASDEEEEAAPAPDSSAVSTTNSSDKAPKHRAEWMRYAGLLGPAVGLGMMASGIGKPDYSGIDAAIASANNPANQADWMPRGDFAVYRPDDPWFYTSPIMAQANAGYRSFDNSVLPSKDASKLALGYNTMIALGNAQRQQLDSNFDKYMKTKQYNGTIYDANQREYGTTSRFNADALNRASQHSAQIALQGAREKMDADAGWYNSLYGNVSGLFKGLSDLGRENAQFNMIADSAADGVYSNLGDSYTGQRWTKKKKAEGGKIKKKRGLTL